MAAVPRPRRILSGYAALIGAGAGAGLVGLVTGTVALDYDPNARLPFASPVLGALALTLVVALPAAVVAAYARRGDALAELAALAYGALLLGWVVVQLALLHELSLLHACYAGVGTGLLLSGRHRMPAAAPLPQAGARRSGGDRLASTGGSA